MEETPTTYEGLVGVVIELVNILIPAMFAILFMYFIWKMLDSWVLHADDPGKVQEGKTFAITAVLVFVVMVSVWGIIAIIRTSFFGA